MAKEKSLTVNRMIMGVLIVMIGLNLLPMVIETVNTVTSNLTDPVMTGLVGLISLVFVIMLVKGIINYFGGLDF